MLCEAGGKQELRKIAELSKKKTGTSVTLVELPYDGLFNRLLGEFSSGAVSFDVAALDAIGFPLSQKELCFLSTTCSPRR
ncbi:hypothetical protein ACTMTU_04525 [Streptomyces sp. OZ13]|uniref:hypothetical protein n=1 Tax=Streptomyces sp. OZ13 TaxID=3452210 RepID=UPI003F8BA8E2